MSWFSKFWGTRALTNPVDDEARRKAEEEEFERKAAERQAFLDKVDIAIEEAIVEEFNINKNEQLAMPLKDFYQKNPDKLRNIAASIKVVEKKLIGEFGQIFTFLDENDIKKIGSLKDLKMMLYRMAQNNTKPKPKPKPKPEDSSRIA